MFESSLDIKIVENVSAVELLTALSIAAVLIVATVGFIQGAAHVNPQDAILARFGGN